MLASARARVPGIVHDRSGSGQTVFVEPLEVIEANNDLALLAAEERREVERLLREFGVLVLSRADELRDASAELAALDALEAKVAFGEIGEGRLPEITDDGSWTLRAARHPLLDRRFEALRRRVLESGRDGRDAVPLDLELPADRRLLVVSGPNAGGKTVVLKTAGLFAMLAQCGIPLPAGAGTRVPVFRSIRTEIGDAQAILSDRSTFSSSMEILAGILAEAGPGALALIDEIGGATDPEEGSALAVAFLEAYLESGGRVIATTHLGSVKTFATSRPDSLCAAMEFDEKTGRPNYHLHPGLAGRSRALSVAEDRGIPAPVLERARAILGEAWQRRERARERRRARARAAARGRSRSSRPSATPPGGRRRGSPRSGPPRGRALADARRGARQLRARARRARAEGGAGARRGPAGERPPRPGVGRAHAGGGGARRRGGERPRRRARGPRGAVARASSPGTTRASAGSGVEGTVISFDGNWAHMEIQGKRLRVRRADLEPAHAAASKTGKAKSPSRGTVSASARGPVAGMGSADVAGSTVEVHVIGQRLEEALDAVEKALDQAILAGAAGLRVVHGHGTGRLREGIRQHFRGHGSVARSGRAIGREGGNGATILELR